MNANNKTKLIYIFLIYKLNMFGVSQNDYNKQELYNTANKYYREKKYIKAQIFAEEAVKKENNNGNYLLGMLYENGYDVKQDLDKAVEYYKLCNTLESYKRIHIIDKLLLHQKNNENKTLLDKIYSSNQTILELNHTLNEYKILLENQNNNEPNKKQKI